MASFKLAATLLLATALRDSQALESNNGDITSEIIGGDDADAGDYPWFAMPLEGGFWGGCGGMLVAPEYVLTAAHCPTERYDAYLIGPQCVPGSDSCTQSTTQEIGVEKFTRHPQYDSGTTDNDFALVKLSGRATVSPVPMDQGAVVSQYIGDEEVWAIGFGNTGYGYPDRLQDVKVSFVTENDCNVNYDGGITSNMLCAAEQDKDSCQGDSGGPLYDKNKNTLIGVVSWGYGCALPNYPGVYAKVAAQWNWIKTTICDDHSSPKPDFCGPSSPTTTPAPTPSSPTGTPPGACQDVADWEDSYGDGCDWYEENEAEGQCDSADTYAGEMGPATEACCHCGRGENTTPSPTPNPTIGSTPNPTPNPTPAPTIGGPNNGAECFEHVADRFFKKFSGGSERTMTCKNLATKSQEQIDDWCSRTAVGIENQNTAQDVCLVTCEKCGADGCYEKNNFRFYFKTKVDETIVYKNCQWLARQRSEWTESKFAEVCSQDAPDDSDHGGAGEVCPITCGSCS